jgi:hypothetical protein
MMDSAIMEKTPALSGPEWNKTPSVWTQSGVYCEESGRSCERCPAAFYGLHADYRDDVDLAGEDVGAVDAVHKCHQPKMNELLKRKGITYDKDSKAYRRMRETIVNRVADFYPVSPDED